MLIVFLQGGLIFGAVIFGGTVKQLRENAYTIFEQKVVNRKNVIERSLQDYADITQTASDVQTEVQRYLALKKEMPTHLTTQNEITNQLLKTLSPQILALVKRGGIQGAYLILDGNGSAQKAAIYLRRAVEEGTGTSLKEKSTDNFVALYGAQETIAALGLKHDANWQEQMTVDGNDANYNFYTIPFKTAQKIHSTPNKNLGYWSVPFSVNGADGITQSLSVAYSIPLRTIDGTAYGVLGIEVLTKDLEALLPVQELSQTKTAGYVLASVASNVQSTQDGYAYYTPVVQSGNALRSYLPRNSNLQLLASGVQENFYHLQNLRDLSAPIELNVQQLNLYGENSVYSNENWVLIGIELKTILTKQARGITYLLIFMWITTFLLGLLAAYQIAQYVTRPIAKLVADIKKANPAKPLELKKSYLIEIDALSESIQLMSTEVTNSAHKLSQILEMAGVTIGAFDYDKRAGFATCTRQFLLFMNLPYAEGEKVSTLKLENAKKKLEITESVEVGEHIRILCVKSAQKGNRWYRLQLMDDSLRTTGVVTDVTNEIMEKRKIEHDRDYDALTGIHNRRAFQAQATALFNKKHLLQQAAMLMLDLDNLKFVNDTYGHDCGDEYIRSAAATLKKCAGTDALVARLSGDEFAVFIYGCADKDVIRMRMAKLEQALQETKIYLPDGTIIPLRASGGYSWYPQDATTHQGLLRYADFAMYIVKKTEKGRFNEFDNEVYNKNSYLLRCREELNVIIEKQQVEYQFQPIVCAKTGCAFAFEALMRPKGESIKSPAELISLARSQGKLSSIEKLTMFRALECFTKQPIAQTDCKLFLNSISNQLLTDAEVQIFIRKNEKYLHRLVIELTEEEEQNPEITNRKRNYAKMWGAQIALDDFGTGYNGETVLVEAHPDYIKLDTTFVRNINVDESRLHLMKNLISYAKSRGIKVIAEGVETKEEMITLIRAGVDYLQGYYLAHPSYNPHTVAQTRKEEILLINQKLQQGKI
ncbi:MAG: GGDEF and EAL domain-containing protein [Oscillospiraceae bacterium]|nr:GGDEF and EAL domain-containing protein [Oscillospiraceae bacterium]